MAVYVPESFTSDEADILRRYFTNLDGPVFALVNLPEVVKGALFARYSRSPKSLRRLFLDEFVGDLDISGDHTIDLWEQSVDVWVLGDDGEGRAHRLRAEDEHAPARHFQVDVRNGWVLWVEEGALRRLDVTSFEETVVEQPWELAAVWVGEPTGHGW